jgi:predicted transposase/invertase (TIGR01784 family)
MMIEIQDKDSRFPDPMSDVFTAAFWSNPKFRRHLRSYINGVRRNVGMPPIVEATVLNPFNVKDFVVSKKIVLDVRVKDERDWLYDIEVQNSTHTAFLNRMVQYWSETYSSQMRMGLDYTILRPVMSIILTAFPIFPELHNIQSVFRIAAEENPNIILTEDFQIHFLRISEFRKRRPDQLLGMDRDLRDWLYFFGYGGESTEAEMSQLTDSNPLIKDAYDEMQRFFANPETRELARERRQFIFDFNLGMDASKAEGIVEGEAKGEARTIVRQLTKRFGSVPSSIEENLYGITDLDKLDRLADSVIDCQSLEEFKNSLAK